MAEAGLGIGTAFCYQIERRVASKKLKVVLEGYELEPLPVHREPLGN